MSEEHHSRQLGTRAGRPSKDFKRAYKACIPCRKTKARCDVDPDSTSCVRCKRERKECVFPTERSSRKRRKTGKSGTRTHVVQQNHDSNAPGDASTGSPAVAVVQFVEGIVAGTHRDDVSGHSDGLFATRAQRRPSFPRPDGSEEGGNEVPAVSRSSSLTTQRQSALPQRSANANLDTEVVQTVVSSSKDALGLLFKAAEQQDTDDSDEQQMNATVGAYDSPASALTNNILPRNPISRLSDPAKESIDLWNQHRFVRQGWFSAREAVTYIDLFFRNLSHLSPISDAFYADHGNHKRLILEEPLLCCTLLMISSRHHILPGQGGASRADFIHTRLWKHVEHLIHRITFGLEKYSIAKTRTLGSVKALLLVTEWHPRALHFPPDNDGWDASLAPSIDDKFGNRERSEDAQLLRWREEVFEPAKRSDRMSWMLVGLATTLAYELGVFEDSDAEDDGMQTASANTARLRVRRLLFLYVNQLCLRLGCPSILPQSSCQSISYTPVTASAPEEQANHDRDMMLSKWIEITKLLKTATDMFFPNKSATRQILRSGRYVSLLEHFQPLLAQWYKDFLSFEASTVAEAARQVLFIEYSYARMYINSLAIQALVERVSGRSGPTVWLDYDFLRNEYAQDFKFIHEVTEASCDILSVAVKLGESGNLRHCPVRIFLRVVSASIFLLKAISLGARNSDIRRSLTILDHCIQALRSSTQDDIHLSARYGMLIARHVRRFKRNFRVQSGLNVAMSVQPTPYTTTWQPPLVQQGAEMAQTTTLSGPNDAGDGIDGFYFDPNINMDDWLAQPFDPSIAPFGTDIGRSTSGLELDSLDFLWNLPS